jgi:hypothetical protein
VIKVDSLGVPGAGFNITIAVVRTVSEDVYDDLGASSFVTNLETRAEAQIGSTVQRNVSSPCPGDLPGLFVTSQSSV